MISLPVSYIVDDRLIQRSIDFDVQPLEPIESRGTNEATFQSAIKKSSGNKKKVLQALYRELVLANYAELQGKRGSLAKPLLNQFYPDTGVLPGFIRTSGRFNAAGMVLHNLDPGMPHRRELGYRLLPALLDALVRGGGLERPQCIFRSLSTVIFSLPDEVALSGIPEGAKQRIVVNAYERSPKARKACLAHHGYDCACCGFNFERRYGSLGRQIIHVHHLRPLADIGVAYHVNPITDLIPVCPNCHAMLHREDPPYTISEIKMLLNFAEEGKTQLSNYPPTAW